MPQNDHTPDPSPAPHPRRKLKMIAILLVTLVVILTGCNLTTRKLMYRHDASLPRDPNTGVILGAEPRTLGPEDADTAIIFVHGFVGSGNNFWEIPDRLSEEGYRVRVMLNKGHGTTPQDFHDIPRDDFLPNVLDEIHELQKHHEKIILAGHSMGGTLITLAAAQEDIDGLILGAPYFGVTYQWYYLLPVATWNKLTGRILHRVYKARSFVRVNRKEAKDQIFSYSWIPSGGTTTLMYPGEQASKPEILDNITAPILHFHAPDDFAADYQEAVDAVEKMASKNKTHIPLENSDHHIYWDNDREQLYAEILKFLDTLQEEK